MTRFFCRLNTSEMTLHLFRLQLCIYSETSLIMSAHYLNGLSKTLEDPAAAVFCRGGAGNHYRECRQRCRRHLDVLVRRGTVWPSPVVDRDSHHPGLDSGAR